MQLNPMRSFCWLQLDPNSRFKDQSGGKNMAHAIKQQLQNSYV